MVFIGLLVGLQKFIVSSCEGFRVFGFMAFRV